MWSSVTGLPGKSPATVAATTVVPSRSTTLTPFEYKDRYVTPAGATESTVLVFDLPARIEDPYLGVRGLFLLGDLKDLNQYRRKRVRLF
jgi:hypothetical protein